MRKRFYRQGILSYLVAQTVLVLPVWEFTNAVQPIYVGGLSFMLAYCSLDKLIAQSKKKVLEPSKANQDNQITT